MSRPKVIAVSGVKNSGKTTLLEKLIRELSQRGRKTAVIKHDGHSFAADREGTDTWKQLEAGAVGTAIYDGEKFQVVSRQIVTEEMLMEFFPQAEIIFLEGFKESKWPKVEVVRGGNSEKPVCSRETLKALVTDLPMDISGIPRFGLEDIRELADWLLEEL